MKIKVNNRSHEIPPISKLSFETFNKVFVEKEVFDLKGYISLFVDMPVGELMTAELKAAQLPLLHASIYDVDIENRIKNYPNTLKFKGTIYMIKEMSLATFGQNYIFDLFYDKFKRKEINEYQLCLYATACAISKEYSTGEVEEIYEELSSMPWIKVLPASFFLGRKFSKKKANLIMRWVIFTLGLKKIKLLSSYRMTRLRYSGKS